MSTKPVRSPDSPALAAGYDLWSSTYDQYDNPMVVMADAALRELLPRVAGWRILELGCGTGRNAVALLEAGAAAYVGVDVSPGMLDRARARLADRRVTFIQADLLDPLPQHQGFTLVLFSLVLEHVHAQQIPHVFSRAAAALAPGGLVRAHEIHPELRAGGTQAHFRTAEGDVLLTSHPHTAADLRAGLATAGLELVTQTDRYASTADVAASAKLAKHLGRPFLIELTARGPTRA
jgi:SAM-dependent methyltransferase